MKKVIRRKLNGGGAHIDGGGVMQAWKPAHMEAVFGKNPIPPLTHSAAIGMRTVHFRFSSFF